MPELNPKATEHIPFFITAPGETDVLMVIMILFMICAVVAFGVFYFRLHALPEHIAHKAHKVQMEIVSLLCLIALFTHEHIFWIAGLILAFIDIPDFGSPLGRIAKSAERIAGEAPADAAAESPSEPIAEPPAEAKRGKQGDAAAAKKPAVTATTTKEPSHA